MRFAQKNNDPETPGRERSLASLTARAQQERCDAIKAEGRDARQATYRAPLQPLPPTENVVDQRIAEELEYARRVLDSIGNTLVSDPILVARHQQCLQNFDILGQLLGHLASVVGTSDRASAIARIGMEDLRKRLTRPTRSML